MITIFTKDARIKESVRLGNLYFQSTDFAKDVRALKTYLYADCTPEEILDCFTSRKDAIEIICYNFGWKARNVLGKEVGDGYAHVNSRYLDRSIASIAATAVHEAAHVVDGYFRKRYFGHGDNSSVGKGTTFTYHIGNCAEVWVRLQLKKIELAKAQMAVAQLETELKFQREVA